MHYLCILMDQEFILRLFVAAMLGGAIGLERELRAKVAGFRTHFLVALGSCLFMIISQFGFATILQSENVSLDPSRIASQVVTGIGFIGAGTIILQKHVVKGLTTAAGLWVASAIGLTSGCGLYVLAVASTVLALLCLEAEFVIRHRFGMRSVSVTFSTADKDNVAAVMGRLKQEGVVVDNYNMKKQTVGKDGLVFTISMEMKVKRDRYEQSIVSFLKEFEGVEIEGID